MRIVGGRHRGRKLWGPANRQIRPTPDRAREALFDILEHRDRIRGARFLDLCAGTGAVGLEAFSRGASEVLLVEADPEAVRLIRRNLALLGDPPEVRIVQADARRLARPDRPFDLAFLDPPYRSGLAAPILAGLLGGWLSTESVVVVELAAREPVPPHAGFILDDDRRYGAARFLFFLRPAAPRPA